MRPGLNASFEPPETPVVRRLVTRALVGFIRLLPPNPAVRASTFPKLVEERRDDFAKKSGFARRSAIGGLG